MAELENRDSFQSKIGFILACVGSAVGMGNIWMFPYRVGQLGGAAFLIPYFIFIALLGFTGVVEEMSLGRAMGTGPLGAFKKALERRGKQGGDLIGLIPVFGSLGIAIGYTVVVGWIIKFALQSITGAVTAAENSGAFFGSIAGPFGSVTWHIVAIVLSLIVMCCGISSGIEKVNKIMMPLFFLMFIFLAIRVFFLPGAFSGYEFMLRPDWIKLADPKTWIFALGQAFFSLSLAGSGTVVYGSYLKKDVDVIGSAVYVAVFDTIAAMLAAFVIIPAVFSFGFEPSAGPPLMFIVMPEIFKQIPLGAVVSSIFFIAVLFAGVTSLVNLYETPIEALQQRFHWSRGKSVSVVMSFGFLIGLYVEDGNNLGMLMDFVSIYIIPVGALLAAIMFFWVCGDEFVKEQIYLGREKKNMDWIVPLGKYIFCGLTIFVILAGIVMRGIG